MAIVEMLPGLAGAGAIPLASTHEYLMGTVAEVRLYAAGDAARAGHALEAALEELRTVDRLMAVQRPESDVSRINREAARGPVAVDPRSSGFALMMMCPTLECYA